MRIFDVVVEEFFDGGSLEERLGNRRVCQQEVIDLVIGLFLAVRDLQPHRLVHRDIKPANIMFRMGQTEPVLVDFGIVRDLSQILDPQLYCPRSERGELPNHRYFPQDMDTADPTLESWWRELVKQLVAEATELGVDAVCSPVALPRKYSPDYYALSADTFSLLQAEVRNTRLRPAMGLSWRQYLAWFLSAEQRLSRADALTAVTVMLRDAERRWDALDEKGVLLQERRNDGRWLRPWRQASGDFRQLEL